MVWVELSLFEESNMILSKKGAPLTYRSEYKQTEISRRNSNLAEGRLTESFRVYDDLYTLYKKNQQ
jgi:hypothetical protein